MEKNRLLEIEFLNTAKVISTDLSAVIIQRTDNSYPIQLSTRQIVAKIPPGTPEEYSQFVIPTMINQLASDVSQELYQKYCDAAIDRNQPNSRFKKILAKVFGMKFPHYYDDSSEFASLLIWSQTATVNQEPFVVLPLDLCSLISTHGSFVFSQAGRSANMPGIYPLGEINGMSIWLNPMLDHNSTQVLLGSKVEQNDAGVYIPMGELEILETDAFAEDGPSKNQAIRCRLAIESIGDTDSKYEIFQVVNRKKPFFRKLFNL
jgi:hypothetical protein